MDNVVKAKSAWFSVINWTAVVSFLAAGATLFGIDLDAKTQAEILAGILALTNIITVIRRTFFNNTVSPDLAGRTVRIEKA